MALNPQATEREAQRRSQSLLNKLAAESSDKQLLERFVAHRDNVAFECLVQRHGAMVFGVCQRVLNQRQDAEDAFQATFLVLVQKASTIRKPELLGNWLYGVACRIARKARGRVSRRVIQERNTMAPDNKPDRQDPSTDLEWRDLLSVMDEELQQLPNKYRLPLVMCYLSSMTNEEAAAKLGWPAGSMSYRLAKAREMLQKRMERRHRTLPAGFFASLAVPLVLPSADLIASTVSLAKTLATATAATALPSTPAIELARDAVSSMAGETRFTAWLSVFAALLAAVGIAIVSYQLVTGGFAYKGMAPYTGPEPSGEGCWQAQEK